MAAEASRIDSLNRVDDRWLSGVLVEELVGLCRPCRRRPLPGRSLLAYWSLRRVTLLLASGLTSV